jgi:hypothetical protein
MGDVNSWEFTCAPGVGMFLPFPVISLGGCKFLRVAVPTVVLPCAVLCDDGHHRPKRSSIHSH